MITFILFYIFPFITVIFTTCLLIVIYKKTPIYMKSYKFYVFQNVLFTLSAELAFLFCPCIILHPILQLEPIGLTKYYHYNFMLTLCGFAGCCYLATLDCITVMLFERYFTMKSGITNKSSSKIPRYIYYILIFIDFINFIIVLLCIFVKQLSDIYQNSSQNGLKLPIYYFYIGLICLLVFMGIRLCFTFYGCFLNMQISEILKTQRQLSSSVQKSNNTFRRLIFIHVSGFFIFQCCPLLIIIFTYSFIAEPSNIPNYCVILITAFGFYDVLFTAIFIKPYKRVMFSPIIWFMKTKAPLIRSMFSL